ncbi:unnamed protein product [Linum trigynum]|uniref:RING-type E3 ubiquitin transferase n=1 Tax=Linum trigynum TaxID=586398 RepID=A0AAV2DFB3_9ROSI
MEPQFPDDFKCPISLEVMSDPVILPSGHTFDRSSIQRWLDSGHRTCPITNLPLPDHPSLIPNHALRSLISNYAHISSSPKLHLRHPPPETLISTLTSPRSATPNSKLDSLSHLAKLTKFDPSLRRQLAESGALSAVFNCLDSPSFQEKSLSLLLNLSLDDDNKVGLVAEGAIGRVVSVLRAGSSPISRAIGCTVLTSLAVVEVNKATIGAYPDAIRSLVNLLDCGKGREVKEAATALYAVCSFPDNRRRAVECGAVAVLARLVGGGGAGLERAVEVLSSLVKCREGRVEMGRVFGFVGVLVQVISFGGEKGIQCALFTLNALCLHSEEVCDEARGQGVMEICVGLREDDENEKIRRNASSLVQTLSGSN